MSDLNFANYYGEEAYKQALAAAPSVVEEPAPASTPVPEQPVEGDTPEATETLNSAYRSETVLETIMNNLRSAYESKLQAEEAGQAIASEEVTNESFDATHSRLLGMYVRGIMSQQMRHFSNTATLESASVFQHTLDDARKSVSDINLVLESAVLSGIDKLFQGISESFSRHFEGYGALKVRVENLRKALKDKAGDEVINLPFKRSDRLSVNGKVDPASIIGGLKAGNTLLEGMREKYLPEMLNIIDTTTSALNDVGGEDQTTEDIQRKSTELTQKLNSSFAAISSLADVGVLSGDIYLIVNAGAGAGEDGNAGISVRMGHGPEVDNEKPIVVRKSELEDMLSICDAIIDNATELKNAALAIEQRCLNRYHAFRENYNSKQTGIKRYFSINPLFKSYLNFFVGSNALVEIPNAFNVRVYHSVLAVTLLADSYLKIGK